MSGIFFTCKHEDRFAGKGFTSTIHCNSVHKFIPMPQAMKIPDAKAAAWQLEKFKSKKEVILEAQKRQNESPLCHTDGHLSPHERGVGTQIKKYKGRVVLRGDTIEDDSGAYAVFTEQGSSASQMTAFKAMDIIARLPDL